MPKLLTVSIRSNAYAENIPYIGTQRGCNFPCDFDALEWLSGMLATGNYKLSAKSKYSVADVIAHEQAINNVKTRK